MIFTLEGHDQLILVIDVHLDVRVVEARVPGQDASLNVAYSGGPLWVYTT